MNAKPLPLARLQEMLEYSPETGELRWKKKPRRNIRQGSIAGCVKVQGYRRVLIDGESHMASRIAWALHYGVDPGELEVDHINRDRDDNRIDNLRLVTRQENCANRHYTRSERANLQDLWRCTITGRTTTARWLNWHQSKLGIDFSNREKVGG